MCASVQANKGTRNWCEVLGAECWVWSAVVKCRNFFGSAKGLPSRKVIHQSPFAAVLFRVPCLVLSRWLQRQSLLK